MRVSIFLLAMLLAALPALVWADAPPQTKDKQKDKDIGKSFAIPFRLTESGHILVRAKINGKGPFNFIVDTGAPAIFVSTAVADKLGIEAKKKGMTPLDKFQIEGGPAHTPFKCIVETPPQLDGINALGLAGAEINGVIGYTLLAHYKMEIDLTREHMNWTKLDFNPPQPLAVGDKAEKTGELDSVAKLVKQLGALIGAKGVQQPKLRGFFGIQLAEKDKTVVIQEVLAQGPAAKAKLMAGDRLVSVQDKKAESVAQVTEILAKIGPGQTVRFVVERKTEQKEITVTAGEGL